MEQREGELWLEVGRFKWIEKNVIDLAVNQGLSRLPPCYQEAISASKNALIRAGWAG